MRRHNILGWIVWGTFPVLAPYLAWRIAQALEPLADLRGPYLVASPFLAMVIVGAPFFLVLYAWLEEDAVLGDKAIQSLSDRVALKAGAKPLSVYCRKVNGLVRSVEFHDKGRICCVSKEWVELSPQEREFAFARVIYGPEALVEMAWSLARYLTLFIGMVFAACNLWLVLAAHISYAAFCAYGCIYLRRKADRRRDEAALRLTMDFDAALQFVNRQKDQAVFGGHKGRVAHLTRVAHSLGLAA